MSEQETGILHQVDHINRLHNMIDNFLDKYIDKKYLDMEVVSIEEMNNG